MKNLFVLLVGIDKYRDPDQPLNGCVKDIDALEKFINRHYSGIFNIELVRLANEQATYANNINAFRSNLRKAGPDDTAWFHFSGHGTEEWTATEFSATDPNSRDQTLLCYDSGHGSENLADKELAVLLHEVATTSPGGESKGTPHIVVSLDCCHSGSGTRHGGDEP